MRELTEIELGEVNGGLLPLLLGLAGVIGAAETLDEASQEFFDGAADAWYGNGAG